MSGECVRCGRLSGPEGQAAVAIHVGRCATCGGSGFECGTVEGIACDCLPVWDRVEVTRLLDAALPRWQVDPVLKAEFRVQVLDEMPGRVKVPTDSLLREWVRFIRQRVLA